ncbi:MAG TPA: histone deacetylase [candidate division Zixibacteria bacterium]|nr:histone deacetylase [candidate division Zixibacteria bacterium]
MNTLLGFAPALEHLQPGHPESPQRMLAIIELLESSGVLSDVTQVDITQADFDQIGRVHSDSLVNRIRQTCEYGGGHLDPDTYATIDSYRLARIAAGTTVRLLDQVMVSDSTNGIAIVRPPGHHAERVRVGGFCLFNNVAIAARQAQVIHKAERVLIIDIDVHHGNGTQDIFYNDPSVMYVSLHQFGYFFYPGTGSMNEVGSDAGSGYTVNIPFPPGAGDQSYLEAINSLMIPKAKEFSPEVILVSAGFDAHWIDPLASATLSLAGYSTMISKLVEMANDICHGKILFVLEGGYHPVALSHGVLNTIYRLLGVDEVSDPLGPSPQPEHDMTSVLSALLDLHLLN